MASTTTGQNSKLCGDILRIVFDYYATFETLQDPLETVLLVCTDWRDAALSHGRLWAQFQLYVEHKDEEEYEDPHKLLLKRTALRLKRSGMVPLDIEILNMLACELSPPFDAGYNEELLQQAEECPFRDDYGPTDPCPCYTKAYKCACRLLVLLAGPEGEHCKRWRTLTFFPTCYTPSKIQTAQITRALSYPTPLLESLTLRHVHITKLNASFLPSTPSLVQLALDTCNIPSLRGTKNLRFAAVYWDQDHWKPSYQNKACLEEATGLEVLRIGLPAGFKMTLPPNLPKLRELWLGGIELPSSVRTLKMGGLSHLTIEVYDVSLIAQLAACVNEAIWQVNELELRVLQVHNHAAFKSTMSRIFMRFTGVDILSGDRKMLSFTMKLMWEQLPADYNVTSPGRIFGEKEIELRGMVDDDTDGVRLSPEAVRQDVVDAAAGLEVVDPRTTWAELRQILDEYEQRSPYSFY